MPRRAWLENHALEGMIDTILLHWKYGIEKSWTKNFKIQFNPARSRRLSAGLDWILKFWVQDFWSHIFNVTGMTFLWDNHKQHWITLKKATGNKHNLKNLKMFFENFERFKSLKIFGKFWLFLQKTNPEPKLSAGKTNPAPDLEFSFLFHESKNQLFLIGMKNHIN